MTTQHTIALKEPNGSVHTVPATLYRNPTASPMTVSFVRHETRWAPVGGVDEHGATIRRVVQPQVLDVYVIPPGGEGLIPSSICVHKIQCDLAKGNSPCRFGCKDTSHPGRVVMSGLAPLLQNVDHPVAVHPALIPAYVPPRSLAIQPADLVNRLKAEAADNVDPIMDRARARRARARARRAR